MPRLPVVMASTVLVAVTLAGAAAFGASAGERPHPHGRASGPSDFGWFSYAPLPDTLARPPHTRPGH